MIPRMNGDALAAVAELSARGALGEDWSDEARRAAAEARRRKYGIMGAVAKLKPGESVHGVHHNGDHFKVDGVRRRFADRVEAAKERSSYLNALGNRANRGLVDASNAFLALHPDEQDEIDPSNKASIALYFPNGPERDLVRAITHRRSRRG